MIMFFLFYDRMAILSITSLALHLQLRETDNDPIPPLAPHLSLLCGLHPIIDQVRDAPLFSILTTSDIIDLSRRLYLVAGSRLEE